MSLILLTHSSCLVPRTSSNHRCGSSTAAVAEAVVEEGGDIIFSRRVETDFLVDFSGLMLGAKAKI